MRVAGGFPNPLPSKPYGRRAAFSWALCSASGAPGPDANRTREVRGTPGGSGSGDGSGDTLLDLRPWPCAICPKRVAFGECFDSLRSLSICSVGEGFSFAG